MQYNGGSLLMLKMKQISFELSLYLYLKTNFKADIFVTH